VNKTYELPILLYHRIVDKNDAIGKHKIYVRLHHFKKQLEYLKQNNYQTITFYDIQKNPTMDFTKKVILTFDDGYEDNYTLLFPLLKQHGFTATIYLVTNKQYNTWGMKEGEPQLKLMNQTQIREMASYGIEMGGHTCDHLDLSKCDADQQQIQIAHCKKNIEELIGKQVVSFAYPFGGINDDVKQTTQNAGYLYAVSTNTGPKVFGKDNFQVRRIEVTPKTSLSSFKRKVSGKYFSPNWFQSLFSSKQKK
jgi:peptidoglycan/xylan/chitin deacetylase (PgdA/CDA1 family)